MSKKALLTIATLLSIILMSENSFAASFLNIIEFIRKGNIEGSLIVGFTTWERQENSDFSGMFIAGIFLRQENSDFSGMFIAGIFFGDRVEFGLELSALILPSRETYDSTEWIYSGNLCLNIPLTTRSSLFITAGVGSGEDFYGTISAGVKIKYNKLGIRFEYRRWEVFNIFFEDGGGGSILGGVSWFF
jgi:hypothetical protein